MSFRLVSKSVTLNDLERCNGRDFFFENFAVAAYITVRLMYAWFQKVRITHYSRPQPV